VIQQNAKMTDQKKIEKAFEILSTVRNTVSQKLEEVDQILKSINPSAEGKKKRRNLKEGRVMDFDRFYSKKRITKSA
jgi:hypothetical protein